MIGMIISGHGNFATGLQSSLNLIAGDLANFAAVDFTVDMGAEDLSAKLSEAITTLKQTCSHIIVFTDLAGGSPFKTASLLAASTEGIDVIAGSNLPMLIEINGARAFMDDPQLLVTMAINTGKEQIVKLDLEALLSSNDNNEPEDGDGI